MTIFSTYSEDPVEYGVFKARKQLTNFDYWVAYPFHVSQAQA